MEIIDLSIELNDSTRVQGEDTGYSDPPVIFEPWVEFEHKGYRVTKIEMCAHSGTHVDVPYHFVRDGKTTSDFHISSFVGWAVVMDFVNKGPISIEMVLPFKGRIAGRRNVVPVIRNGVTDRFTSQARQEILSWRPSAVLMGEGINIDETYAESTEFLNAGILMIMNSDHSAVAKIRDNDLIVAAPLKATRLEAAPVRLFAIRGLAEKASNFG